jgi:cathepsin L
MIEFYDAISSGVILELSLQKIAACSPNPNECGCTGNCHSAVSEVAYLYVGHSDGMMTEAQYPNKECWGI